MMTDLTNSEIDQHEEGEQHHQPLLQPNGSNHDHDYPTTDIRGADQTPTRLTEFSASKRGHAGQCQHSRHIMISMMVIVGCLIPIILWSRRAYTNTELLRIGPTPFAATHTSTYEQTVYQSITMCIEPDQLSSTNASAADESIMKDASPPGMKFKSGVKSTLSSRKTSSPSSSILPSIDTCQRPVDMDVDGSTNSSTPHHFPSPANLRSLWRFDGLIPDEQLMIRAEEPFFWVAPKLLHKTTTPMNTSGRVDQNTHRQPNMIVRVGSRFTVHVQTHFHWSDLLATDGTPIKLTSLKGLYVWFYAHPHFMVAADIVDGPTQEELILASEPLSRSTTGMITLNFTFSAIIPDVEWYECLIILRGTSQFWHLGGDEGYTVQVVDENENEAARTTLTVLQRLATSSLDDPSISHILSTLTIPIPTPILCDSLLSSSSSSSSLSRYLPTTECVSWNRIDPIGGRWVSCHLLGPSRLQHCLRDGWLYVPSNCYYTIYDPTSINTVPVWIVWAGSSIIRGNFLTQVDLMLQHRASTIGKSDFWKCWGWMDLRVGKYRISYLDFRWDYWMHDNVTGVTSVNPDAKIDKDYVRDARSFLRLLTDPAQTSRLSQKDQDATEEEETSFTSTTHGPGSSSSSLTPSVPDIIIFESPIVFASMSEADLDRRPLKDLMWLIPVVDEMIDPKWTGRKVLIPQKLSLHWRQPNWHRMHWMMDSYLTSSVASMMHLNSPWEMVSDSASLHVLHTHESYSRACHPHDRCNENGKHVCSIADEMTVTMLLNDLLKSNRTGSQQLRSRMNLTPPTPVAKTHSPHPSIRHRTRPSSPRPDCSLIFPQGGSLPPAQTARASANQLHFCTQCPPSLVPFRMSGADVIHPQCHRELYDVESYNTRTLVLMGLITLAILLTTIVGAIKYKYRLQPFCWCRWCIPVCCCGSQRK